MHSKSVNLKTWKEMRANTSHYCGDTYYLMCKKLSSFIFIYATNFQFFQITLSKYAL